MAAWISHAAKAHTFSPMNRRQTELLVNAAEAIAASVVGTERTQRWMRFPNEKSGEARTQLTVLQSGVQQSFGPMCEQQR
jgi:hypothetical protein